MKEQGDIWVVAKTLKAFNRLRVAWEEDYGASSIPVEPPPARWADCSEADWVSDSRLGVAGRAMRRVCYLLFLGGGGRQASFRNCVLVLSARRNVLPDCARRVGAWYASAYPRGRPRWD